MAITKGMKSKNKINRSRGNKESRVRKGSIKTRIFLRSISLVTVVVIVLGGFSVYQNYSSTFETLKQTMVNLAQVSSDVIANKLDVYKTVASEFGLNPVLSDLSSQKKDKLKIISQMVERYELVDAFTVNAMGRGESPVTGELYVVNDTEYFASAMDGTVYITEPELNKKLDKVTLTVAAPLWKNGSYGSSVNGVAVIVLDGKVLSDVSGAVKIGKNGYGFILNNEGLTIGHPEYEKVLNGENAINLFETDANFKSIAEAEKKLMNGEIDYGEYSFDSKKSLIAYSPISGSNSWGFFVSAPESEYLKSTNTGIVLILIVSALSLVAAYFGGMKTAKKIADPVIQCADRIKKLSEGNLHSEINLSDRNDEVGILIESLRNTINGINIIINDISCQLGAISEGDLSNEINMEYIGDFNSIAVSMKKINLYLNSIVSQVNESSEQVAIGSEQVASGAQSLSQGASEQSASIEELSATLSEISKKIKSNASNAEKASEASHESSKQVEAGSSYVKDMNKAMSNISQSSQEIAKIIKVIDDIAFQTNILALNAAVEAARAGEAGKGFAVVADEVRNLASKSARAAKTTSELIANSLKAVEDGSKVSKQTEMSLDMAVEKSEAALYMIEEISRASVDQASAISQVLEGVEQISSIIQTNSATAEESAAASQELSEQSQKLKKLVESIKLRERLKESNF
ncbi:MULTISPECIES: methyl-accepting chemotaxis protein [unclassified Sedimentibacter]|uniref:methyl-accepting chemotaxis protein n=1 Tax=unclassified Sedimentibacter TaxID=2649220 RepID=UPI0027DF6675|nr:methyl-accepting chemotaxis protein [Sedimentibacter sp. MB35-C1]WMJ78635.1 methyl-accepting chemotaxis protein [Sedimentibacter sp. MB35-C1]